jgi:mannose-6-phosphate isomerase-like protein (cupin superfamily)
MKTTIIAVAAFIAGAMLGAPLLHLSTAATSVATPQAQRCPWPPELDAVRAAPGNHRVLLDNDRVRVLDVTVAPGAREPVHAHCLASALVVLQGGRARDYDSHGHVIDEGKVIPDGASAPFAFWLERTPPHSIENLDTIPIHLIRVEIKAPTS